MEHFSPVSIYPVDFKLKEDVNPMCLIPYSLQKVHEEMFKKYFGCLVLI